jgi:hypothetical protein
MLGKNEIANAWDLTPAYLYVKFTTEFPPSAFSELAEKPPPTTCLTPLIANRYKARYRG